jgi:hypothetical protein
MRLLVDIPDAKALKILRVLKGFGITVVEGQALVRKSVDTKAKVADKVKKAPTKKGKK